jgi:hypothetical protein
MLTIENIHKLIGEKINGFEIISVSANDIGDVDYKMRNTPHYSINLTDGYHPANISLARVYGNFKGAYFVRSCYRQVDNEVFAGYVDVWGIKDKETFLETHINLLKKSK